MGHEKGEPRQDKREENVKEIRKGVKRRDE